MDVEEVTNVVMDRALQVVDEHLPMLTDPYLEGRLPSLVYQFLFDKQPVVTVSKYYNEASHMDRGTVTPETHGVGDGV